MVRNEVHANSDDDLTQQRAYSLNRLVMILMGFLYSCASVPIETSPQQKIRLCLGEKKETMSDQQFLKKFESTLKYFTLPQAVPAGVKSYYAVVNPFGGSQKPSQVFTFSVRETSLTQPDPDEAFPVLPGELFNTTESVCREALISDTIRSPLESAPLQLAFGKRPISGDLKLNIYFGIKNRNLESRLFYSQLREHISRFKNKLENSDIALYAIFAVDEKLIAVIGLQNRSTESNFRSRYLEDSIFG